MRVDPSRLYRNSRAADCSTDVDRRRAAEAVRGHGGDDVTLSSQARLVAMARRALDETPGVRPSVVEAARHRLTAGPPSDGRSIAEAILQSVAEGGG